MENNENSAKEKVEQVVSKPQKNSSSKTKKENYSTKVAKEKEKARKRFEQAKIKKEKKEQKKRDKALLEKQKKEKKAQKQQLKEQQKAKKLEQIKQLKAEKQEQKKQKQQLKEQLKAKKQERKNLIKNESKEERKKRLAKEKALKEKAKKERKAKLVALKKEKLAKKVEERRIKLAKKEEKRKFKQARKQDKQQAKKLKKQNRGHSKSGWLATVISLGTACLVLATLLTIFLVGGNSKINSTRVEFASRESFSNLVDSVDNIDVNLSKIMVSADEKNQQKLLIKISEESVLAEQSLQDLPLDYENKYYTAKFVNQLGDYAKYLNNRLIDGHSLRDKDFENLQQLYTNNLELKNNLLNLNNKIMMGSSIDELFDGKDSLGITTFSQLEERAVDYPQLIYDGPFSDGLRDRVAVGIVGEEISEEHAKAIFKQYFNKYNLAGVEVLGETTGQYECFNVMAHDENGVDVYAQISKKGGNLIQFNYPKTCNQGDLTEQECINSGLKFLNSVGLENMVAVWSETNGKMLTVNYAYKQGKIIVYSDLIKLNICREKAQVFGMEAKNYYLNHKQREIDSATINQQTAISKVSSNVDIDVESVRLAIIPYGQTSEVLAYEIYGTNNGTKYFVYINAKTGSEVEIFKVVETDDGNLLM